MSGEAREPSGLELMQQQQGIMQHQIDELVGLRYIDHRNQLDIVAQMLEQINFPLLEAVTVQRLQNIEGSDPPAPSDVITAERLCLGIIRSLRGARENMRKQLESEERKASSGLILPPGL